MEKGKHIKMSRFINAIVQGAEPPAPEMQAAIAYAQELASRPDLQAAVRAEFKTDLAERDIKRAKQLVTRHNSSAPPIDADQLCCHGKTLWEECARCVTESESFL